MTDKQLRDRAGGDKVISFMESNGFKLTQTKENSYGYWFKESEPQMTEGLSQARYMFGLIERYADAQILIELQQVKSCETYARQDVYINDRIRELTNTGDTSV